ncbi:hypothetical protein [Candidatus Chloroploca sp. Khr17]|nr:hypothetical protein [Candidatus Chloroploca sp. Khr17]
MRIQQQQQVSRRSQARKSSNLGLTILALTITLVAMGLAAVVMDLLFHAL